MPMSGFDFYNLLGRKNVLDYIRQNAPIHLDSYTIDN